MVFSSLLTALDCSKRADVITVIGGTSDYYLGKMLIIHEDGRVEGEFDDSMQEEIAKKIKKMSWSRPTIFFIENPSGGQWRLFWDRITNKYNAIVFGGGHVSQPLVQMLSLVDFMVTVIDDRPEFANISRFPSAHKVICESFHQSFTQVSIDTDTAVIIVTRGHKYDMECLRATIGSKARYLGMIGSQKRVKEVLSVLREEGVPTDIVARLKAPIGLRIGAETPAEIAVSIVAEVIGTFHSLSKLPLSHPKEVPL